MIRKRPVDLRICSHQHNLIVICKPLRKLNEYIQPLRVTPIKCNSQYNLLIFQSVVSPKVRFCFCEYSQINAIIDGLDLVSTQERILRQAFKPMGGGNDHRLRNLTKPCFFRLPHKPAQIDGGRGKTLLLGTAMTAGSPFFAAGDGKMGADCSECPAVMKRPHHRNTMLFDISKQKR